MTADVPDAKSPKEDPGPHREMRNRFLRRAALTSLSTRLLSTAALLGVTPLLARHLGIEGYGVLATLTSTAIILGVADFGIANGLISKIASSGWDTPRTTSLLSAAGILLTAFSTVAIVAAGILTWALPWPRWLNAPSIENADLRLATLFALLGAALSLTTNLGQKIDLARQRGHAVALWAALAAVAGPVGALVVAMVNPDLPTVVAVASLLPPLVLGCETVVGIMSLPHRLRPRASRARRADIVDSMRSGSVFLGLGLVTAVSFQMDTIIVSGALGASAAAQFNVVVRLFGLIGVTIRSCMGQLWSAFAEAVSRGDMPWARQALLRTTLGGGAAALVANVALVVVGQPLVEVWLGPDFRPTLGLLVAAALWSAYSTAVHPLAMFLNGSQMQGAQLLAAIPMALTNVGLSLYLVGQIGSSGPLIGSLTAHILCVAVPMSVLALRRLQVRQVTAES